MAVSGARGEKYDHKPKIKTMTQNISDDQRFSLFTVKVKFLDTKTKSPTDLPDPSGWQPFHSWKQERYEAQGKLVCDHQAAYKLQKNLIEHKLYSPYRTALLYLNITREGKVCRSKEDKGIPLAKFVYGRRSTEISPVLQFRECKHGIVLDNVQIEVREGMVLKEVFQVIPDKREIEEHIQMNYVFWKKKMEEYFYRQKKDFNRKESFQTRIEQ